MGATSKCLAVSLVPLIALMGVWVLLPCAKDKAGEKYRIENGRFAVNAIAFSPNGKLMGVGDDEGIVKVYDADTGHFRMKHSEHWGSRNCVKALQFTPDSKSLVSVGLDGRVVLLNCDTGRPSVVLHEPTPIRSLCLLADGTGFAIGDDSGNVTVRSLPDGVPSFRAKLTAGPVVGVTSCQDSRLLAVANAEGAVIYDLQSKEVTHKIKTKSPPSGGLSFHPNTRDLSIACGHFVETVKAPNYVQSDRLNAHASDTISIVYSRDGNILVSGGYEGSLRIWKTADGSSKTVSTRLEVKALNAFGYDSESKRIAIGGVDGTIAVFPSDRNCDQ